MAEYTELAVRRGKPLSERPGNSFGGDGELEAPTDRIDRSFEGLETITADLDAADFDATFEPSDFAGGP